ncbi:MAG TPA: amidase [Trueperaceae bacterium]
MDDTTGGEEPRITVEDVSAFEKLAGISFTEAERWLLLPRALEQLRGFDQARRVGLDNSVAPALYFDPRPPAPPLDPIPPALPGGPGLDSVGAEDLPFLSVSELARLLRSGSLTSLELTRLCLERLERFGPKLRCLVTLTSDLALEAATRADEELAAGIDRGALHGIPYGAKDLLAVPGYPTTWGASPYRDQRFEEAASVVERLERAGAVLVAKLSLGELAMGDVWFGGMTLSPWDPGNGSSGSSAGSAAAVAAGLVPFAIGSETMGSIISPSIRCGVVGLRPSANRVSRYGAMALAWSLDKLGPLARTAEDCALVLQAIAGPDGKDASVVDFGFEWDGRASARDLKVGYVEKAFGNEGPAGDRRQRILEGLESRGIELVPIELPDFGAEPIMTVLMVEAAAAFDALTRRGGDDHLAQQGQGSWPNLFRAARLVPAVEYVQANRLRSIAVKAMSALFEGIDAYLCPSGFYANLFLTNATGNPSVSVPLGLDERGVPVQESMTVSGGLYAEQETLTLAREVENLVVAEEGGRLRPDLTRLP